MGLNSRISRITFLNKASGNFFLRMMTFLELYYSVKYYYISRNGKIQSSCWKHYMHRHVPFKVYCRQKFTHYFYQVNSKRAVISHEITNQKTFKILMMKLAKSLSKCQ